MRNRRGRLCRLFGPFEFSLRCNGLKPSRAKRRSSVRDCGACACAPRVRSRVCICSARTCIGVLRATDRARLVAPRRNFISRMFDLRKKIALTRSAGFVFCKPRRIFNNFSVFLERQRMPGAQYYARDYHPPFFHVEVFRPDNAFLHWYFCGRRIEREYRTAYVGCGRAKLFYCRLFVWFYTISAIYDIKCKFTN